LIHGFDRLNPNDWMAGPFIGGAPPPGRLARAPRAAGDSARPPAPPPASPRNPVFAVAFCRRGRVVADAHFSVDTGRNAMAEEAGYKITPLGG